MTNILDATVSDLKNKGLLIEEISRKDAEIVAGGSKKPFYLDFDSIWLSNPKIANFFGIETDNGSKENPYTNVKEYISPDGDIYDYHITESHYERDSYFI